MSLVLVMESDRIQQIVISKILQRIGLEAIFAGDAIEVLQLTASHHPELVVLDFVPPETNGSEICRQIKAGDTPQPAVLVFFDKPEECHLEQGSKQGADAYISKLCRPQELVDAILKLLPQQAQLAALS
jgi:twitching motility two-component system response regulator PilH